MGDVIAAFNIEQVSKLTGVPQGRLATWDRDGFFAPSLAAENRRVPFSRIYNFEDVVGLRTLGLLRTMVLMQHLKKAAIKLKRHSGRPWSELVLYVLNREVHFRHPDGDTVEGAVTGQLGATIPLESVAEEMRSKANELRKRDSSKIAKIERDRFIMGNQPVFGGTRIPVSSVVSFIKAGYTDAQIVDEYPDLTEQDVQMARSLQEGLNQAA